MGDIKLNKTQVIQKEKFLDKISEGKYKMDSQNCLCGGSGGRLIAEYDRYGLPLRTVVCPKCGIARSDPYYDEKSLNDFYANDYRFFYTNSEKPTENFFEDQEIIGERIVNYVKSNINRKFFEGKKIVEIGCGAGGILQAIRNNGADVYGCDLGKEYLKYGKSKGLKLFEGNVSSLIGKVNADLVVMNHVLEHMKYPQKELKEMIKIMHKGSYLFVGVPGLLSHPGTYGSIRNSLQNAHVYHFTLTSLTNFLGKLGFEFIAGNEEILSVYKYVGKPVSYRKESASKVYNLLKLSYQFPLIFNMYRQVVCNIKVCRVFFIKKVFLLIGIISKTKLGSLLNVLIRIVFRNYSRPVEYLKFSQILRKNKKYKGLYAGKRCFILGNGPSLKKQNILLLKNEDVFVVNSFFYLDLLEKLKPKYYVNVDPFNFDWDNENYGEHRREGFKRLNLLGPNSFGIFPIREREKIEGIKYENGLKKIYIYSGFPKDPKSILDIELTRQLPKFKNVIQIAIYTAIYLGYTEIYLLGVDMTDFLINYEIDYTNKINEKFAHFYKPEKDEKKVYKKVYAQWDNELSLKSMSRCFELYRNIREITEDTNIHIYNMTIGGGLDVFPRMDYEEFMKKNKELKKK